MSANGTRRWLAIAPLVFWNWCQSPESLYRECLFRSASNLPENPIVASQVRSLCLEASEYSRLDDMLDAERERTGTETPALDLIREAAKPDSN